MQWRAFHDFGVGMEETTAAVRSDGVSDGALGALAAGGGVYLCAKEAPLVIAVGDKVYWDAVNNNIDKTNTNKPFGFATKAAASADTTVECIHWPY
jgi:predicted RecA/RadA family phage recombinase